MDLKKSPLAVVTMVYNEEDMLPLWIRHYTKQVGANNCYILDHGSDDGSTKGLSTNVMHYPRTPFNENLRTRSCIDFCSSLMFYYDWILFADVDEIVIADPNVATDLLQFSQISGLPPVITLVGMDVVHDEASEGTLDRNLPILSQRSWVRANSPLCKPTFISRPTSWHDGFHGSNDPPTFNNLYLFHLAYSDFGIIEKRQAKRNTVKFEGPGGGHHQIPPAAMVDHIRREYVLHKRVEVELGPKDPILSTFIKQMMEPPQMRGPFQDLRQIYSDTLWRIPERFRMMF